MSGWIKIHKKLIDWEWADCPETMALWIHILLRANYEDRKWQGQMIPRGSFVTSVSILSKETGLSARQIRTSLKRLISTNEVTSKTTNRCTVISVCKYDSYQLEETTDDKPSDKPCDKQATSKRQTSDKRATTTKEYKEIYKESISKDIDEKVSEMENLADSLTCSSKAPIDLSFVAPELSDIFNGFLDMRKKIGKPLRTQGGIKGRYDKLMKLSSGNIELAVKIARQSISHEWRDFYELKEEDRNAGQQNFTNDKYWQK